MNQSVSAYKYCYLLLITISFGFSSFAQPHVMSPITKWAAQSNIYEVNLRQYSGTSSITDFVKHLPRLKQMGVEILWFMPVTPIGIEGRKMTEKDLGSYYAVRNYREINPEFGTMSDWKAMVKKAHTLGFRVITDWVPNHSAPDNPWIKSNPEFYAKDAAGKMIAPFDWTDVRKFDYSNRVLRDSMIEAMKFWIKETGIDGFRCDVAGEVPIDFWKECIIELKKIKDVYMLAEAEGPHLHEAGFHTTYNWTMMSAMTDLYSGKKTLMQFDSVLTQQISSYPRYASRLTFTTNHDENSWNGTEFEKYGDAYKTFAVFTHTIYQSIPLIYSGQELPNKKRLKFFVHDPIEWTGTYELADFYTRLLKLRRSNPALANFSSYVRLSSGYDHSIFAFTRSSGNNRVLVVLNFSKNSQQFTLPQVVEGSATEIFTNKLQSITGSTQFSLPAWGYLVFTYRK